MIKVDPKQENRLRDAGFRCAVAQMWPCVGPLGLSWKHNPNDTTEIEVWYQNPGKVSVFYVDAIGAYHLQRDFDASKPAVDYALSLSEKGD